MSDKFVEEITVGGQPIRLVHDDVPIELVELDERNPRIQYRLQFEARGKELGQVIMGLAEVKQLRKDIEKSGGLRERIILQQNGSGSFKVREGNCRTVCYKSLRVKDPKNPAWKRIPARILPPDVGEKEVAILLSDFHVGGKIRWEAHEKAGHIYHMAEVLQMPEGDIALYLRMSKSTVNRHLHAYKFMTENFLKIDNGKYAGAGEGKWSFFDEFFKRKELRNELKNNPQFGDDFCRWVGEGKLSQPIQVRKMPVIIQQPEARKKIEKGGSFGEAIKVVEAN